MNMLTLKGYSTLVDLGYDGTESVEADKNTLAILSGIPSKEISKMSLDKYADLKQDILLECSPSKPVFLVRYKDTLLGYSPPELDNVEAMAAMEAFQQRKNWNALAALMFRPVTTTTKVLHAKKSRFKKRSGVLVKEITNYKFDLLQYKLKKKFDFSAVDLDWFDDFPANLLLSNLVFFAGNGALSSMNIHPYSWKSEKIQIATRMMMEDMVSLITFMMLQGPLLGLVRLSSTEESQSLTSNQENSLIGVQNSRMKDLKKSILGQSNALNGENNRNTLEALLSALKHALNGSCNTNELTLLSLLATGEKQKSKYGMLWLT